MATDANRVNRHLAHHNKGKDPGNKEKTGQMLLFPITT